MKCLGVCIMIFALLSAGPVHAGAWLREKGTAFSSTYIEIDRFGRATSGAYLEYGLHEKTTIGADVKIGQSEGGVTQGRAGLFFRRPLGKSEARAKMAWHLGAGAEWDGDLIAPYFEGGLSWGRGIKWREKHGWVNIDASHRITFGNDYQVTKVDATVGMGLSEQTKAMMQIFAQNDTDGFSLKLAPSVLFKPRKRKFTLQAGAEIPTSGNGQPVLKLGIWREF